ncbi:hypothetical protein ACI2OX_10390 [Bacillus sp. N9]
MDIHKLIFYIHILGICLPVTLTYILIVNIITRQEISPVSIVILAFGYAVMVKVNPVFHFCGRNGQMNGNSVNDYM